MNSTGQRLTPEEIAELPALIADVQGESWSKGASAFHRLMALAPRLAVEVLAEARRADELQDALDEVVDALPPRSLIAAPRSPEAAPIPRVPDPTPGLDLATPAGRVAAMGAADPRFDFTRAEVVALVQAARREAHAEGAAAERARVVRCRDACFVGAITTDPMMAEQLRRLDRLIVRGEEPGGTE